MRTFLALFLLVAVAAFSKAADPASAALDRINAAANSFHGLTASVTSTQHDSILNEDDTQTGVIRVLRTGNSFRMLLDLKGGLHGAATVAIDSKEARVYNPKTNIVNVFSMANRQALVNQFLLLGFGASVTDLKAAYEIEYGGEEKIDGHPASRLVLTPKSSEIKRELRRAELWIGEDGLALQQKFTFPPGNYRLATYANEVTRPPAPKDLDLNPKGATIQHPDR